VHTKTTTTAKQQQQQQQKQTRKKSDKDVLLHGSWNVFMLIVAIETHPAWPPPT